MFRSILASALLLGAAPAMAQSAGEAPLPDPDDASDTFTLALGVGAAPDYEGSDHYRLIPAAAIRGRVGGIAFYSRGTYLYADVLRRPGQGIDFDLGPIFGVRTNRTGKVKDDFVDALPERKLAVEVGGFAGVSWHGLTNPYDTLSLRVDVVKDVGGAHKSTLVTPTIDFGTPLSRYAFVGASLSAEWAGDGYADYYYSISPAESLASGLPAFDADGGFKQWRLGLLASHSLTGDLTHGLAVFTTGSYARLGGDFADSPIVRRRGSPSQWLAAVGLAYTW
jgi:outer membrane protein